MKRLLAVVVAAAAVLGLTACDQFLPEPLAFTVVDDVIVARTCIPLTITSQSISLYASDDDYVGNEIWSTAGWISLPAGSEFAIATPLDGFTDFYDPPADLLSQRFKLEMNVDAGRGGEWSTFSLFAPGDLAEGTWTDSLGEPLDTPCTHERCVPMAACYNNWPQPTGLPTEGRPTFTPLPEPTATVTP
jgi:hypothetical protein